ncbi:MAG: YgiQ family radical SAM protein [Spirochaetia bacterium]|nr:YgiQ family radical SAM protein [Spirochaetia bacterium]
MFLPTTPEEIKKLKWIRPDIILVTGDTYIDSPYIGAAAIGKYLQSHGFQVAIIAQPDINSKEITRLGEPALFWGITGGSVDSMIANYTASGKKRKQDDFTPGEVNNKRPDRAVIAYSNLIRKYFKNTAPLVLGGIEASLRRISHYDFWSNSIRRPLLFDAKADYLVYGMAEKTILELAHALKNNADTKNIRGLCYILKQREYENADLPKSHHILPSFEECSENSEKSKSRFMEMFRVFYDNNDPVTARGLCQKVGDRYLIQNPPQALANQQELDSYYNLDFHRDVHPWYAAQGKVRALETIQFSLTTHRGCYGECHFCAITVHQGRTILSRSQKSILNEANSMREHRNFKGVISDVGGPTANMYGYECSKKLKSGNCPNKRCIFPNTCKTLKPDHQNQISLLRKLDKLPGIKHAFVASGIRYDLILDDDKHGREYFNQVIKHHTSGQLKIAPEHVDNRVLNLMGKPDNSRLVVFKKLFEELSEKADKKQFLTYYFIAAHPGCSEKEMKLLKNYATNNLSMNPEQAQIYTPTPSTWSSVMYYTELNPFLKNGQTHENIFVEKIPQKKINQKNILVHKR